MSPAQTTYSERIAAPPPGTVAGSYDKTDVLTGNVETAAGIAFGRAVSEGTKATFGDKATILGGSLAGFKGISVRDVTLQPAADSANQDKYPQYANMGILFRGEIWAEPREAVIADDPVYFIAATGVLSNSASGALGPIKGAAWTSSCALNGRATVFIPGLRNQDAV